MTLIHAPNPFGSFQRVVSNVLTNFNLKYIYNILEMLGIDLFSWGQASFEDVSNPLPKRRYTSLDVCQRQGIPYRYTPFDQGALANNLDPDWQGACNILSHTWIRRKLQADDFLSPSTYRIDDSHLPHPMIVGENQSNSPDVREVREELCALFGNPIPKCQSQIEAQARQTGVKALLSYFKSFDSHCTLIGSYALSIPPALMVPGPMAAHACAFVKKGDQCAWFDPNHGEIAFSHFDDFARWFTAEATHGVLSFILRSDRLPEDRCRVSQVYDRPEFTESEWKTNVLAERLIQKRTTAKDFKIALIPDYTLETYTRASASHARDQQQSPTYTTIGQKLGIWTA